MSGRYYNVKHHGKDSKREARRYDDLLLLEKAGQIQDLQCQVVFVLAPSVKIAGEKKARPALRYRADFVYKEAGVRIVEDSKDPYIRQNDKVYRLKKHLMKAILNIDILET